MIIRSFLILLFLSLPAISFDISANTPLTIQDHCGDLTASATWKADNNMHVVSCDVTVLPGRTLTVEAGAIVKFQVNADLLVEGKLIAQGTANDPIYFTSYFDDAVGGDTDGTAQAPLVGDWGSIWFDEDSDDTSEITRTVIRYSGKDSGGTINDGAILLDNASPQLSYITFTDNYINAVELVSKTGDWFTDHWDNTTVVYVIEKGTLRFYLPVR